MEPTMGIITLKVGEVVFRKVRQEAGRTVGGFVTVQVRGDWGKSRLRDSSDTIQNYIFSRKLWASDHCWVGSVRLARHYADGLALQKLMHG